MSASETPERGVFRVTLSSLNRRTGYPHWVNFECDHLTIDDLAKALNEGEIIVGETLFVQHTDEEGVSEIVSRKPFALAKPGVGQIELPHHRFVEYEGAVDG